MKSPYKISGLILFTVVALYVLSIGPVYKYSVYPPDGFYAPIAWLHRKTVLKKPLDWYLELWVPE
jgi:hypothetical protein